MPKLSAGIILFRYRETLEVLLVHPGGPAWAKKDVWSIPKGLYESDESAFEAALREFMEETGLPVPQGSFIQLHDVKYPKNGKIVSAWAVEGDCDVSQIHSNTFEMEWPPRSGKIQTIPEIDRGEWFTLENAKRKILPAQLGFIEEMYRLCKN